MKIGSLFSGVGGLELGLERALDAEVLWQVEIDPLAQGVLAHAWPGSAIFGDVRELSWPEFALPDVDIICGGPPCQDISDASRGRGGGIEGSRSGLWREMLRVVAAKRPRWVVWENVDGAAWKRWVPVVRSALHGIGYSSVPIRLRAADVGAPFKGARVFVLAQADGEGESTRPLNVEVAELQAAARTVWKDWGRPPPRALGVPHGVPRWMDRVRLCGNAVVPQCAEVIGHLISARL